MWIMLSTLDRVCGLGYTIVKKQVPERYLLDLRRECRQEI